MVRPASRSLSPCAALLPATVTLAFILAGLGFSAAVNWPGHLSYDSVLQLAEGRAGVYANWHPPVMSWLLGLGDQLWGGTGPFLLLQSGLIYGGLLALVWAGGARSWLAALAVLGFIATPQGLSYPGTIWKDVLFGGATLAGFAALALAATNWHRPWHRAGLLAVAVLLLSLAALARQNGVLVVLFAALAWGAIAAICAPQRRWRRGVSAGVLGLVVMAVVIFAGHWLLGLRVTPGEGPTAQLTELQIYDLVGALHGNPQQPLPILERADPKLVTLMRQRGVETYTPVRVDTLVATPGLGDTMWSAPRAAVAAQWQSLIAQRPKLYLETRWDAFRWLLLPPDITRCVPFYFGIDGPADAMHDLGYVRRWDARDRALNTYSRHLLGTPVLYHGFWALIAGLELLVLLYRRRPADLAVAGLLAGALAFTASFFVISIACDYRYLYALDLSAMGALIYLAADWRNRPRHGRARYSAFPAR